MIYSHAHIRGRRVSEAAALGRTSILVLHEAMRWLICVEGKFVEEVATGDVVVDKIVLGQGSWNERCPEDEGPHFAPNNLETCNNKTTKKINRPIYTIPAMYIDFTTTNRISSPQPIVRVSGEVA